MRYPALQGKRDANESAIIAALQEVGASVVQNPTGKGAPDLIVGYFGETFLLEVKMPGKKLNAMQIKWHEAWTGQVAIVHTPIDALYAIGADLHAYSLEQRLRNAGL